MNMSTVTLARLVNEPYASILCYPKPAEAELRKRLEELKRLDVAAFEFTGEKQIDDLPVLGKGCVGIVILAHKNKERVALKIRRTDADRASMMHEAELLKEANSAGIGPRLLDASENFLLMQFIDGERFPKWAEKGVDRARIRKVFRSILEQCWRLDCLGLDHGELSHAPKHLIITKKDRVFIVDFESASKNRRPANVTSMCHYLFFSQITEKTARYSSNKGMAIKRALRQYKNCMNRENFLFVLKSCGL